MNRYETALGWLLGTVTLGEACKALSVDQDIDKDLQRLDERALCELGEDTFLQALAQSFFW